MSAPSIYQADFDTLFAIFQQWPFQKKITAVTDFSLLAATLIFETK
jgi:hypothetical protein